MQPVATLSVDGGECGVYFIIVMQALGLCRPELSGLKLFQRALGCLGVA